LARQRVAATPGPASWRAGCGPHSRWKSSQKRSKRSRSRCPRPSRWLQLSRASHPRSSMNLSNARWNASASKPPLPRRRHAAEPTPRAEAGRLHAGGARTLLCGCATSGTPACLIARGRLRAASQRAARGSNRGPCPPPPQEVPSGPRQPRSLGRRARQGGGSQPLVSGLPHRLPAPGRFSVDQRTRRASLGGASMH
jgi:hypothetical protein